MLGGSSVGKSSLVSQFMTSEYLHAYDTSIGEFCKKKICLIFLSWFFFLFRMVNLCKFEIFFFLLKSIMKLLYLGNSGIIIEVHDESEPNGNFVLANLYFIYFFLISNFLL